MSVVKRALYCAGAVLLGSTLLVGQEVNANSTFDELTEGYEGWFNDWEGNFSTYDANGGRQELRATPTGGSAVLHYGGPSSISTLGISNNFKEGEYRYLGLSREGMGAVANRDFPDDEKSLGLQNRIDRGFLIARPWSEPSGHGNWGEVSYRPPFVEWSSPAFVRGMMMGAGDVTATESDARDLISEWTDNLIDKYSSGEVHGAMSQIPNKEEVFHIMMPPTHNTYGVATEWHETRTLGILYDTFLIAPTDAFTVENYPDLVADDLVIDQVHPFFYEVWMEVSNDSNVSIDGEVHVEWEFEVGGLGSATVMSRPFGDYFAQGETQKVMLGTIDIPGNVNPNTIDIDLTAEVNPENARVVEESDYSNNMISTRSSSNDRPLVPDVCFGGGRGEIGDYQTTHTRYVNGVPETYWRTQQANIYHSVQVDFVEDKQTLLGIWSRDPVGHNELEIGRAFSLDGDDFRADITDDYVDELRTLGVDNVTRVVRAGRPVQVYGTLEIELDLMSFSGAYDLASRKDRFMRSIEDTLRANGLEFVNNEGNEMIDAEYDDRRRYTSYGGERYDFADRSEGYMYGEVGPLYRTVLGDLPNILNRYERNYKFVAPVKPADSHGVQEVDLGDFGHDTSYDVGDEEGSFFVNIETLNGMYAMELETQMVMNTVDTEFSQSNWCSSDPEEFGVWGNIYDDVRSEDDIDGDPYDSDWDF